MKRRRFVVLLAGAVPTGTTLATTTPWMRARRRAHAYLAREQSPDGAWRSAVYGSFKSGTGLTPLVLNAAWPRLAPERRTAAVDWLLEQGKAAWEMFPVHNAGWLLELGQREVRLRSLAPVLENHLRGLQLGPELGWKQGHRYHGGWSYAGRAARNGPGVELAAMQEPNLSATVLAVAGLRHAGVSEDDPALVEAQRFISRCQNFGTGTGREFDDGGFFQMTDDPSRNKAGAAGTDEGGRKRFRSYFSATADGLRGLLMCGVERRDARVAAGWEWMQEHPSIEDVPDLRFYSAYAGAEANAQLRRAAGGGSPRPAAKAGKGPRPAVRPDPPFAETSRPRAMWQDHDGSYSNPAGEMRENDPLVATALTVLAWESQYK